ncbi:histidine phosphatase family protein [Bdellovibrionales bacterium]|nr:histidine phosphatase family protein [Bdellovibrionales bacterium]
MKELYIFRHGQTDWNKRGRLQGHTDTVLNATGEEQAQLLGDKLNGLKLQVILSSDLQRAVQTAEIATGGDVPIVTSEKLREADLGVAEGRFKTDPMIAEGFTRWLDPKDRSFFFDGGEAPEAHRLRIYNFVMDYLEESGAKSVGVSTHGGSMFRFVESCHNSPSEGLYFKNGSLLKIAVSASGWSFEGLID